MRAELILNAAGMNTRGAADRAHRRSSPIIEWPNMGDGFPWANVLFGYTIAGNVFTVVPGEIHFKEQIYGSGSTPLTIAADLTYVYVEMVWGTGATTIKQSTNKLDATTSSSCFRKWLYLLNYTAPSAVSIKTYGHTGGAISIMPVFG